MAPELDITNRDEWPELLTAEEAAHVLRTTAVKVRRAIVEGTLPGQKLGGRYYVSKRDLFPGEAASADDAGPPSRGKSDDTADNTDS